MHCYSWCATFSYATHTMNEAVLYFQNRKCYNSKTDSSLSANSKGLPSSVAGAEYPELPFLASNKSNDKIKGFILGQY